MANKDYYSTLGVGKDASKEEIKKAYKKLAKKHHPDLNKGDKTSEQKFKEINEAASVLGDDNKRAQYDQFGSDGMKFGGAGGQGGFAGGQGFDFNDIFDSFFGGGFGGFGGGQGGRRGPRKGSDLRYDIDVTLEDVATGLDKTIRIKKRDACHECSGKGGKGVMTCGTCQGSGVVVSARRTPFGMFQTQTTCGTCRGRGEVIKDICNHCNGTGQEVREKTIKISVPEGIEDNTRLRMSDEGEAGEAGAPPGDLYIFVHVKEHTLFKRDESDIYLEVPISYSQAVFGDTIDVPTITGKARLKVPSGTQPETLLRMKGEGLPRLRRSSKGDQYVKITIEVPKKINKKQKELLQKFEKETKEKPPHKRLFDKIKNTFS